MRYLWLCLLLSGCATPPPQPASDMSPYTSPQMSAPMSLAALRDAAQDADAFAPWLGWLVVGAAGIWLAALMWQEWRWKRVR